ncbi:unnamed protein product [Adineta ricciae]|uniref:Uncharacterized protein n=1 Tax=Adineta ricciae TaxID=249248 RepID=A0A814R7B3_ADIRI|nr:unnamed protein product [Adineta ricciae]
MATNSITKAQLLWTSQYIFKRSDPPSFITAVEAEIHRLDSSIQEKQELYKRHLLDDDQFKQMGWDLASRLCLQIDLEELKAERDRRASQ